MQTLMQQQRLQFYLGLAAALTVLSGITMYARLAAATHGAWAGSRPCMATTRSTPRRARSSTS